jgi:hypothetical protein
MTFLPSDFTEVCGSVDVVMCTAFDHGVSDALAITCVFVGATFLSSAGT